MSLQLQSRIITDCHRERLRQDVLKAQGKFKFTCADLQMSEFACAAILGEEYGEICRSILNKSKLTDDGNGEGTEDHLYTEIIQAMAVLMAMGERFPNAIERHKDQNHVESH